MHLMKVWDASRAQKKAVIVKELTIAAISDKVMEKMKIQLSVLVLEEDGTEIDDDEVLKELGYTQILMALADGERWTEKIINSESPLSVEADVTTDKNSTKNTEDDKKTNPDVIHTITKNTLPSGLPHPDKIQLPTLSPALHIALSSGEKNSSIFNQVLKECEIFYSVTYPGMADSSYYQMIGKKMVAKYKCLGYADGTNPWSFFVSKLSQRIRTRRCFENRKSKRDQIGGGDESLTPIKKFRVGSRTREQSNPVIPEEDWENHVKEISKEWENKRSQSHLRTLLAHTRNGRLTWQSKLNPGKFAPIIDKFPCFEEGNFVMREFFCLKNKENPDNFREHVARKIEWIMQTVVKDAKLATEGTETEKSIALIKELENNVNRKKGKGIKSRSCIKVVKNVQKIDSLPKKHLETEKEEAPYLVVFLDQEDNALCIYVIGDGKMIMGQTLNVLDSLVLLLAVYYVFDLDYPEIYSQALGILQQWAVGDQYTQHKSSNWIKFSDLLSRNKK